MIRREAMISTTGQTTLAVTIPRHAVNRIEAPGGTFSVRSPVGSATVVSCKLPV